MAVSLREINEKYFGNTVANDCPIQDFVSAYQRFILSLILNRACITKEVLFFYNSVEPTRFTNGLSKGEKTNHKITVSDLENCENIFDGIPRAVLDMSNTDMAQLMELYSSTEEGLALKMRILFNRKRLYKNKEHKEEECAYSGGGLLDALLTECDFVDEATNLYAQRISVRTNLLSIEQAKRKYQELYRFYQKKYNDFYLYKGRDKTQLSVIKRFESQFFHNDNWEDGEKYFAKIYKIPEQLEVASKNVIARKNKVVLDFKTVAPLLEGMAKVIYSFNEFIRPLIGFEPIVANNNYLDLRLEDLIKRSTNLFTQEIRKDDTDWLKTQLEKLTPTSLKLIGIKGFTNDWSIEKQEIRLARSLKDYHIG